MLPLLLTSALLAGCSGDSGTSSASNSALDNGSWTVLADDEQACLAQADSADDLLVCPATLETLSIRDRYKCGAATRTITSPPNSLGQTQTCTFKLPESLPNGYPVTATAVTEGSYSLVCRLSGRWRGTPSTAICPAPPVVPAPVPLPPPVTCGAKIEVIVSQANSAGATNTCVASLPTSPPGIVSATVTNGGIYSVECQTSGYWTTSASSSLCPKPADPVLPPPPPTPTPTPTPTPVPAPTQVYGLTLDAIDSLSDIVNALKGLSHKPTTRIVLDEGQTSAYYKTAAAQIHAVSFVMGEILDSFYMKSVTPAQYSARTTELMNGLGSNVDIWEVGNEINGEWLGTTVDTVAKMTNAYNLVKGAGKTAALTLYYNEECWANRSNEMFTWAQANVPATMKSGLDYVLISYYEDDCNGLQPNWPAVFQKLAVMFPNSKIGFGEIGTNNSNLKASYINRYYNMNITEKNYIGGYFWWYGKQDFVPMTKPLWTTFNEAIR